jgi:dipeptidyl aminopeptidase/acylaminoacyl peptidase
MTGKVASAGAWFLALLAGVCCARTPGEDVSRYLDLLVRDSQLTAARDELALAWVRNVEGRRSIWVAEGARLNPRELQKPGADDGMPVSELTLSPDGKWLAYIRGTAPNRQGEINNPQSLPDPQERALFLHSLSGGEPRRVAAGTAPAIHTPVFSGDSGTLAFARGREVWLAGTATQGEPTRAFTLRGAARQLQWSPDNRMLAFVSERGTHSFVGIFDRTTRQVRYLAPGIDRDLLPRWSRDGTQLAFLRTGEEVQTYRFARRLEGIPWSIMLADTRSLAVQTLWTADARRGSSFYVDGAMLFWGAGNQLVFSWEKTGTRQLYRLSAGGGKPTPLTEGEGEVIAAVPTSTGSAVDYLVNPRLRERFELYRVPISGGRARALSGPYGASHTNSFNDALGPVPLADGRVAFEGYTPKTPARYLIAGTGSEPQPLQQQGDRGDDAFFASVLAEPQVVELKAQDGVTSRALLYRPVEPARGARRPAVVYVHGGSRVIETLRPNHAEGMVEALVMSGYVVLLPNYRSGMGYGLEFRESPGYGGGGATDVLDVLAAGDYLAGLPEVDARRIGIFGRSYGGYLTTAALARAPHRWAAGASVVGVVDWQMEMELDDGPLPLRLSARMKLEDLAHESSASAALDHWRAPLLLISGDDDQQGWLAQAVQLGQSLRRRGIPVETLVEPGGTHTAATHAELRARVHRLLAFFEARMPAVAGAAATR